VAELPRQTYGDGVYFDGETIRMDIVELLRSKGIEPTPEAVEISARNLQKAAAELGLASEIVESAVDLRRPDDA
jgi:hypothetical protein